MSAETLMLYKLIILYILDKMDFPITNTELTRFIIDKGYTDYITIQDTIAELIEDGYIETEKTHNAFLYRISVSGKETLSYFYTKISVDIRDDIDEYLSKNEYQLREMVATSADYYEQKKDEIIVELRIVERESELVHINLLVTSSKEADTICNRWKECSADIYGHLITTLLADSKATEETEE